MRNPRKSQTRNKVILTAPVEQNEARLFEMAENLFEQQPLKKDDPAEIFHAGYSEGWTAALVAHGISK